MRPPTLFVLAMGLAAVPPLAAQPLTFQMLVVDAGASGDDKETADIDGDGDADGILGGSTLAWYRSNGLARTFGGPFLIRNAAVEFTTDMAVGDLDADGDFDLVVADGNGAGNVRWYENPRIGPPPGGTTNPTVGTNWLEQIIGSHGSWAHDIELAPLDGNASLDVITLGNGAFRIHFQDTPTSWTTVDFVQHASDGSPAAADIDGDGDRDLFVKGGWIENPPSGKRVAGNWIFHPITSSDPGDGPAAVAFDVNRDGKVDLVTCPQHVEGALAWFRNPADPESAAWPRTVIDASAGSHHLRVADFDGDARQDLLAGLELAAGYVKLWRITGSPPVFTPVPVASGGGGHNAAVGDLDGNGLVDVWAADWIGNPPLRAYFNGPDVLFRDGFETGNTSRWSTP
jgi:hypothetical protein